MTRERAESLLARMAGRVVVVAGDLFLDEYLVGRAERLSREGPVPVLRFAERMSRPGGAANPARNIAALGSTASQIGLIGEDDAASELRAALIRAGILVDGVVVDVSRPTTVKTRIVAEGISVGQQVARIDRQSRSTVRSEIESALIAALRRAAVDADAVLVSHYRSGVVSKRMCEATVALAKERPVLTAADAQGDLGFFEGFDIVRVGRGDAAGGLGRTLESEQDFLAAATELREKLRAEVVVLGRGECGMSVADSAGYEVVPPANVREVYDVVGAGDTVIAVMTLALVAGATAREAAVLANAAAGVVVRRLGVAAPTPEEILAEMDADHKPT